MAITNSYKKVFQDTAALPGNITIDLVARYAAAFGMMASGNFIEKVFIEKNENKSYSFQTYPVQPLGNEGVEYSKLEIPGVDVLEFNAILEGKKGTVFAPPLLFGFSQEKNLVETEVNDDEPVVIERWGTKPWDITIEGLLIDFKNRTYPSEDIERLNKTWQYNGVVKAIGKQFREKGIDTIYFRSIVFTLLTGYQDTVKFNINASSIKAVNFTLLKPNL